MFSREVGAFPVGEERDGKNWSEGEKGEPMQAGGGTR